MADVDTILLEAEEAMDKATEYLRSELRGVRTGRATTGLVDHIKIDYYGSSSELRQLAMISVPEPTQILIKPFDPSSVDTIAKGLQNAGLGFNPQGEGKQIRINIPSLSGDRRAQMVSSVKQMGEQAKVTVRNARRDANKQVDAATKAKSEPLTEDQAAGAKDEVQGLVKKYESQIDKMVSSKIEEIETV